jgi:hypothetical protein
MRHVEARSCGNSMGGGASSGSPGSGVRLPVLASSGRDKPGSSARGLIRVSRSPQASGTSWCAARTTRAQNGSAADDAGWVGAIVAPRGPSPRAVAVSTGESVPLQRETTRRSKLGAGSLADHVLTRHRRAPPGILAMEHRARCVGWPPPSSPHPHRSCPGSQEVPARRATSCGAPSAIRAPLWLQQLISATTGAASGP